MAQFAGALLLLAACSPPSPSSSPSPSAPPPPPTLSAVEQTSGTVERLQAVHALDRRVVWASGLVGTWARSVDGGATWRTGRVPGAAELQFRDVHAFDEDSAFLLAAGPGEASRIYETTDGGESWALRHLNREPRGFLDCFAFWDRTRGLVYGDSVDGRLVVLETADGGTTWRPVEGGRLPAANPGEGGFAASGTCVAVGAGGRAWIATGAGGSGRVLRTDNGGTSWTWAEAPTVRGEAAGLTSVAFRDAEIGIAVGGDLGRPEERTTNVAWSLDGGVSWHEGGRLPFPGAAYGSAWAPGDRELVVAVGPGGLAFSLDRGRSWIAGPRDELWAVDFGAPETFWAVGPNGRIIRFELEPQEG